MSAASSFSQPRTKNPLPSSIAQVRAGDRIVDVSESRFPHPLAMFTDPQIVDEVDEHEARSAPNPASTAVPFPLLPQGLRQLLYTPEQAAVLLTVRPSWLRRGAAEGAIACTYLGKHLRFSDADLHAIIADNAFGPRPE